MPGRHVVSGVERCAAIMYDVAVVAAPAGLASLAP